MCLLSISFLLSFCRELPCKTNGVFSLLVKITCRGTLGLTQASILDHDGDGEQWAPFTSGLAGAVLFVCFSIHKGLYKKNSRVVSKCRYYPWKACQNTLSNINSACQKYGHVVFHSHTPG